MCDKHETKKCERICLLTDTLDGGGIGVAFITLAKSFAAKGHVVDLVVFYTPKRTMPNGVNLVVLNTRTRGAVKRVQKYFEQHKPDIIISARDYINVVALFSRRLARWESASLIWTFHTQQREEYFRASWVRRGFMKLAFHMSARADHLVGVSQGVAEDVQRFLPNMSRRVNVIPNPVDVEDLTRSSGILTENKSVFCRGEPKLIVASGRLVEQKGYPDLLRAFAIVRQTHDAHLKILGDGPMREILEAQVGAMGLEKNVSFLGYIDAPMTHLRAADCFVSASHWEGFGLAIAEALAIGCPIVATDCSSGPRELLLDGALGTLVPTGDIAALVGGICEAFLSKADNSEINRESLSRFEPNLVAQMYLDLARSQ